MPAPAKLDQRRVVDAALALVDVDGAEGLGIRAVARSLDVAPNALARHVGDLDELREHVARRVVADLADDVRARVAGFVDPADAAAHMAVAYAEHALARPQRWPLVAVGVKQPQGKALLATLVDATSRALADDDPRDAHEVALALWGSAHGTTGLTIEGAISRDVALGAIRAASHAILTGAAASGADRLAGS